MLSWSKILTLVREFGLLLILHKSINRSHVCLDMVAENGTVESATNVFMFLKYIGPNHKNQWDLFCLRGIVSVPKRTIMKILVSYLVSNFLKYLKNVISWPLLFEYIICFLISALPLSQLLYYIVFSKNHDR